MKSVIEKSSIIVFDPFFRHFINNVTVSDIDRRPEIPRHPMSLKTVLRLADRTERIFQVNFGTNTLPGIILGTWNNQLRSDVAKELSETTPNDSFVFRFNLPSGYLFSGRIIIAPKQFCIYFETINNENEKKNLSHLLDRIAL